MRIGIDARLWNETGVGRYIRSLFRYLQAIDTDNEYVWFFRDKEYKDILLPSKKWKKVRADIRWHTLSEQLFLPLIFYREKLDLLHFPYFSFPIFYPGKFIVTIHDLIFDHFKTGRATTLPPPLYFLKKIGYHVVNQISIRRAEKIVTLSQASKKEIIDHYQADPGKIIVTYEAGSLESAKTTSSLEKLKIKDLQPFILYVGNAHPHKNVEALIDAMAYVHKEDTTLKLVLIGSDPFFYPRLKETIKKSPHDESIVLIGEVPNSELVMWYKHAGALISASKMEGFGIPPLEAMSVGCPVIVSDILVFHEIYSDAAVYFDHTNPQDIAETIIETLNNKELIDELITKGYKRAKMYSWEKMTKETLDVYKMVKEDNYSVQTMVYPI